MNLPKPIQNRPSEERSTTTNNNDATSTYAGTSASSNMSEATTPEISKLSLKNSRSFGSLNHRKSNTNLNSKNDDGSFGIDALSILEEAEDIVTLFQARSASIYKFPVLQPPKDYNSAPELPRYLLEDSEDSKQRRKNLLVAQGKFQIYRMLGKTAAYVRCGQFIHPILPKMRLWRVLVDQFVFPQPNPGKYWRLEISELTLEDTDALESILYDSCSYQRIYVIPTISDSESNPENNVANSEDIVLHETSGPKPTDNTLLNAFTIPLDLIEESPEQSMCEDIVTTSEASVLSSIFNEEDDFSRSSCRSINSDEDQQSTNYSLRLDVNFSDEDTDIEQTCDKCDDVPSIPMSDEFSQYGANDDTLHSSTSFPNIKLILEPFKTSDATATQNEDGTESRTSPSCHETIFKELHSLQNSAKQSEASNWALPPNSPTSLNDYSLWNSKLFFKPACQLCPVDQSPIPSMRHRLRTSSNDFVRSYSKPSSQSRCEDIENIELASMEAGSNLPSPTFPQRTLPDICPHFLPSFKVDKLKTEGVLDALLPHYNMSTSISTDLLDSDQQKISHTNHTLVFSAYASSELKSPKSPLPLRTWNFIMSNIWPQNNIALTPSKEKSD